MVKGKGTIIEMKKDIQIEMILELITRYTHKKNMIIYKIKL